MRYTIFVAIVLGFLVWGPREHDSRPSLFIDPQFPVKVTNDIVYAVAPVQSPRITQKSLLLDLYEPDGKSAPHLRPGFVAVHGGGLVRGDKRTENMVELCRELAARGYVCVSINYRLVGDDPAARGPTPLVRTLNAAIEDSGSAMAWLQDNAGRYNVDPTRIAAGGSSAGAQIVLRLAYGTAPPKHAIAGVLSWVGGLDGDENIIHAKGPPLFIVNGADDRLVPVVEARALAQRAAQVGLPHKIYICEGLGHTVPLDRRPGGVSLYRRLAEFLWQNMDLANLGKRSSPRRAVPNARAQANIQPRPCPH